VTWKGNKRLRALRQALAPNRSQNHKNRRIMMECLQCGAELDLAPDVEVGEIVICPDCGAEWEVMSVDPITLEAAPEVQEDWGE
jgi:alpha-aminoadipate carrier protein LysW